MDYNNRLKYTTILCMSQTVGLRFLLDTVIINSYFKNLRFNISSGMCCCICATIIVNVFTINWRANILPLKIARKVSQFQKMVSSSQSLKHSKYDTTVYYKTIYRLFRDTNVADTLFQNISICSIISIKMIN